ncbi:MAG: SH3 domain-containing protein, partial [Tateyamaria sp.]
MRVLAVVLCLWALPAAATQDAWPALYDVSGVAENDALNIRQAPDAAAPIIGSLTPDAEGIEVIRPDDHHGWGLVNSGEGRGWVSLRYLTRQPGQWAG